MSATDELRSTWRDPVEMCHVGLAWWSDVLTSSASSSAGVLAGRGSRSVGLAGGSSRNVAQCIRAAKRIRPGVIGMTFIDSTTCCPIHILRRLLYVSQYL